MASPQPLIFRKGLDMKQAVAGDLAAAYHSSIVDDVRINDFQHSSGRLTVHLAREFGFCYGVDRAVDYAYQAQRRFPGQNVFLTGEIIHNPHVNERLRAAGIRFLSDPGEAWDGLGPGDVVILPAFGVTVGDMARLTAQGCTLVDTTCGSVLNVWKNVVRYARDGFTSIIHGKVKHEETRATASQALQYPEGRFLVVLDRAEAEIVCDYIRRSGDRQTFLTRFGESASPGFDPDRDLRQVGCANQTTMLMSESLEIGEMIRAAMVDRYGEQALAEHFRAFDTICSATQERQDAVVELLSAHRLDLMIVIGGYNSSNTCNLARICAEQVRTFHIADPESLASPDEIHHRPVGAPSTSAGCRAVARQWLPPAGPVVIGLTAGASTPNSIIGQVIQKLDVMANQGRGKEAGGPANV
ncbi:MAG TPA: 4-hydroxy-3-methylbut-2-enyl diphosphate reductase [Vicinamibacterales bacterium]|nr:4-hydroxy-3-methylbut-2-enyl diphosphate reductase [Vicinamibacterales bacterium]